MIDKLQGGFEKLKTCWEVVVFILSLGGTIPAVKYWSVLQDLLPLPGDLFWRGITFALGISFVFGVAAIWRVCAIRRPGFVDPPDPNVGAIRQFWRTIRGFGRPAWVQFLFRAGWAFGWFVLLCFAFDRTELLWKSVDSADATRLVYYWLEPLVFALACAALVVFLIYVVFIVVELLVSLSAHEDDENA